MKATNAKAAMMAAMMMAATVAGAAQPAVAANGTEAGKGVAFETLERYMEGYWTEQFVLFVTSPEEWAAAMADLEARNALLVAPSPAAPNVDWTHEAVILASLGTAWAPASIEIQEVRKVGTRATVDILVKTSVGTEYATTAQPYHMVKVERGNMKTVAANYENVMWDGAWKAAPEMANAGNAKAATQNMTWGALKGQF